MFFKYAQEKIEQKKQELEKERRETPQRLTQLEEKILNMWVDDVPIETISHYTNLDKKIILDIIMQNENVWMRMIIEKKINDNEDDKRIDENINKKIKATLDLVNKIKKLITVQGD